MGRLSVSFGLGVLRYALGVLTGTLHRMDEIEDPRPDVRCNVCETNAHTWTEGILISFWADPSHNPFGQKPFGRRLGERELYSQFSADCQRGVTLDKKTSSTNPAGTALELVAFRRIVSYAYR